MFWLALVTSSTAWRARVAAVLRWDPFLAFPAAPLPLGLEVDGYDELSEPVLRPRFELPRELFWGTSNSFLNEKFFIDVKGHTLSPRASNSVHLRQSMSWFPT